jgi:hypothetical protein
MLHDRFKKIIEIGSNPTHNPGVGIDRRFGFTLTLECDNMLFATVNGTCFAVLFSSIAPRKVVLPAFGV